MELVGDDDRLVGFAGVLPLGLLAERTGLRAGGVGGDGPVRVRPGG